MSRPRFTLTAKPLYADGSEGEIDEVAPSVSGDDLGAIFAQMAGALADVESLTDEGDEDEDRVDAVELVLAWGCLAHRAPERPAPPSKPLGRSPSERFSPYHDP